MIDWTKIAKEYPKAYNKLVGEDAESQVYVTFHNTKEPLYLIEDDEDHFKQRDLFDFFDNERVMVEIGVDFTRVGYGDPLFSCKVVHFEETPPFASFSELLRTREEAEDTAFTKAFEILENRLNE